MKQILAPQRCKTLREGDILMEINKEYIRDMPHNAVVQRLKECPQGQETVIVVQRGGKLQRFFFKVRFYDMEMKSKILSDTENWCYSEMLLYYSVMYPALPVSRGKVK